jgi:hypothetical protein
MASGGDHGMQWPTVLHVMSRRQLGREAAEALGFGEGVMMPLSADMQPGSPGPVSLAVAGKGPW